MNFTKTRSEIVSVIDSSVISTGVCILILLACIQQSEQFLHWFIIPITLSGILIGIDAVDWFRHRVGIFDPVGILGVIGFHFFFLAPLLHVSLDLWLAYVSPPPDWRPWLGNMAALNFLGLWIYRLFRSMGESSQQVEKPRVVWKLNPQSFPIILCGALLLSAMLQVLVYIKFGGVLSYIATATDVSGSGGEAFSGLGPLFMISESFPVLAMIGFVAYAQKRPTLQTITVLVLVLISFVGLRLFFGGLRGSRSNTIWAVFWAVGMIHFWLRPISKKAIALGLVVLVMFMYVYGFFKSGGLEGLKAAFESQESRVTLEEDSGRTWKTLLLQDLGRSDVQAFMLYRLSQPDVDYEYARGRTYAAALTTLIPSAILPDKPPSKSKEGTDLQYGMRSYLPGKFESSKVYGLAGEAMLNFGPVAVPISFAALGLTVGIIRRWYSSWDSSDTRSLLLPFLVNFCFVVLVSDLDNDLFFLFKQGAFPFFVILISSKGYSPPAAFDHFSVTKRL